jgi:hypothetical protein
MIQTTIDSKKCEDCGDPMHPESRHDGYPRWCEGCFESGLYRDMDDHFLNFVKEAMEEMGIL